MVFLFICLFVEANKHVINKKNIYIVCRTDQNERLILKILLILSVTNYTYRSTDYLSCLVGHCLWGPSFNPNHETGIAFG